eukprot:scaffold32838_cov16-Tisochrysis_lutea.AAC.1
MVTCALSQVSAAIMKLHTRRVTVLEFHPQRENVVLSADKKGGIAAWDFAKVNERTLYSDCHKYLVSGMKHVSWFGDPTFATGSAVGPSLRQWCGFQITPHIC